MSGPKRLLMAGLIAILAVLLVKALTGTVLIGPRFAVDMEIPLRAAERWLAGEAPYLATAFTSPPGATQPFLYPPYVLPLFALLVDVPRGLLGAAAVGIMLIAALAACRRLGVPWIWLPLVIAWPPFSEAIFGANIQMLLFGAFVFLFYRAGPSPWAARPRDVEDPAESDRLTGGLATIVGAVKVSQPYPWLYVLRHRPKAAIGGALVVAAIVAATVPLTTIDTWFEWAAQLGRATDRTWDLGGFGLARFLPPGFGLMLAIACAGAVILVPPKRAGAWVGLLSVVGSLSLHIFGLLFLVPAMLVIRREAAVVAAIFIATYSYQGAWAGIIVCAVGLAMAERAARRVDGRPEPAREIPHPAT